MKQVLIAVAFLSASCAYETSMESDDVARQASAAVVRAKSISFEPLPLCGGLVREAEAANVTCKNVIGLPCPIEVPLIGGTGGMPVRATWRAAYVGTHLYFHPNDEIGSIGLKAESWAQSVSKVVCRNAGKDTEDAQIHYLNGLPRKRSLLITKTVFEHVRDVHVRGTVDVAFHTSQGVGDSAIEVALQTANSAGQWVDKAVAVSTEAVVDSGNIWHGKPRQLLEVSATVPANDFVVMRVRTGAGISFDTKVSVTIHAAELRGEECVPSNIPGECL